MHSRVHLLRTERQAPGDDRSVAQLIADLLSNMQDILHAEIRLAQARAREELRSYRPPLLLIVTGALGGLLGCCFVLLAAVAALGLVIPIWAAALSVGLGMAVICAILLRAGISRLRGRADQLTDA
jgi:hypothetical protein